MKFSHKKKDFLEDMYVRFLVLMNGISYFDVLDEMIKETEGRGIIKICKKH